jgi:hypothetical protein
VSEAEIERERLELDRQRLGIEKRRAEIELRFFHKHLGAVLAAAVSLAGICVSASQIWVAYIALETTRLQKEKETELAALEKSRQWNLDLAEFVAKHREVIFSGGLEERTRIRNVLMVAFPPEITKPLFERLVITVPEPEKIVWQEALRQIEAVLNISTKLLLFSP